MKPTQLLARLTCGAGVALLSAGCEPEDPSRVLDPGAVATMHAPSDERLSAEAETQPVASVDTGMPSEDGSAVDAAGVARDWMRLLYERVAADRLSPPVASRAYALAGIALYEAASPGDPSLVSLGGQLNEMPAMPAPGANVDNWAAAASSAAALVASGLLTSEDSLAAFEALLDEHMAALGMAPGTGASAGFGRQVGQAVLAWSASDGFADTRQLTFEVPTGPGLWVPTSDRRDPLEPYWGQTRPFAMSAGDACKPPPPPAYSLDEDSDFWSEVMEVYDTTANMDPELAAIADFWADTPGETGTPPGHWIALVGQLSEAEQLGLAATAEAYALTGVALADSFIACWDEKFRSNYVRPVSVIQAHIDPDWNTHVPTPPFPEYTSGHSTASAAAATVLTRLFGQISFQDETHVSRGLPPRSFVSFEAAAQEAAISRLYGGIHFRSAIERGLEQGECVAGHLIANVSTRR